eukprot:jgi/Undpi1/1349/HiC_scaffold_11.g04741.m1
MSGAVEESAVVALEALYSGPMQGRELSQAREIFAYLRSNGQGAVLTKVPSINNSKAVLDIVGLFNSISKRGGVRRVQEQNQWKEVLTELGHPFDRQTLFAVSVHYKDFLYGYEQVSAGVNAQQQYEQYQRHLRQRELEQLPRALGSDFPSEVCAALNTLTLETFDAAEELILDAVPGLLEAIFDLMDKLNPAVAQVASLAVELCSRIPKGVGSTLALLDASFSSAKEPGGLYGFTASGLPPSGRGELLLLLLNALRNASFVPSNERTIAHSARAVQHFVSLCSATSPEPAVFAAALDLFGRVTKHLDIWGRRAADSDFEGCKWAEDSLSYLAPAHVRLANRSAESGGSMASRSSLEYVSSVALVFPTLVAVIGDEERSRVMSALAIISKLAQTEENKEAFNRMPDSFLQRLVELLSIPHQGCDVLAPNIGASSPEWLEYNCRVLPPSVAGVDIEVRDASLEVIALLAGMSDNLRSRVGAMPGCVRTLARFVISSSPGNRVDAQARRTAARTLTALASVESNHVMIKPLYSEVLVAAARDASAADLLLHSLKDVFSAA